MLRFFSSVWGRFKGDEAQKFFYLSLASFFLVGAQWPLHILRDSIFINTVGSLYQPTAKFATLLICIPMTLLYTILVEVLPREKTLYFLATLLSCFTFGFAGLLWFWSHGYIANQWVLGWCFYVFADVFSVLSIAPFWAFVNDITYPGEAKRGYGMIVLGAQLGGLCFTVLASLMSRYSSLSYSAQTPFVVATSAILILVFIVPIWRTMHVVRAQNLTGYKILGRSKESSESKREEKKVTFFSGLRVLLSNSYVAGIFIVTSFQEILSTLMSYRLYRVIEQTYDNPYMRHIFIFDYSLLIQVIATLFALLGTSYFQQRFGIRACLIGYPILLAICTSITTFTSALYFVAAATAAAKALNFSLNKPVREVLYIPTSRDVKYKSKAWIEFFGARASKMGGALFNRLCGEVTSVAGGAAILLTIVWAIVAERVGTTYHKTVADRVRIG